MCARGERHVDGDEYEITHDGQDSRLDRAVRQRLCFDEQGVSSPNVGECMDTFRWGTCGGECNPTPVPTCRIVDGSCRAVTPQDAGAGAGWETAAYAVSLNDTRHGTLRLFGNRYEYEGDPAPAAFGAPFYFMVHPTGELDAAQSNSGHSTIGRVRFNPEGADFNAMDPRRSLQVRRDDGIYWMHSIVSEFQNWTIRAE